jgi:hypothetical protein
LRTRRTSRKPGNGIGKRPIRAICAP